MSQSELERVEGISDWSELRGLCEKLSIAVRNGKTSAIPEDVITRLLTISTLLFHAASHENRRPMPAFEPESPITATAVVVTVSAMLRAAELNSFDLAMWFTARPPEY